jgi:hypothetical protein
MAIRAEFLGTSEGGRVGETQSKPTRSRIYHKYRFNYGVAKLSRGIGKGMPQSWFCFVTSPSDRVTVWRRPRNGAGHLYTPSGRWRYACENLCEMPRRCLCRTAVLPKPADLRLSLRHRPNFFAPHSHCQVQRMASFCVLQSRRHYQCLDPDG